MLLPARQCVSGARHIFAFSRRPLPYHFLASTCEITKRHKTDGASTSPVEESQQWPLRRKWWTADDIAILRQAFTEGKGPKDMLKLLPGRSKISIVHQCCKYGLTRRPGRKEDNARQVVLLAQQGLSLGEIKARMPHLSVVQITSKAWLYNVDLKVVKNDATRTCKRWSTREDEVLRQVSQHGKLKHKLSDSVLAMLPGRSATAIDWRVYHLHQAGATGIALPRKAWTRDEFDTMERLYHRENASLVDIASALNRSFSSVRSRFYKIWPGRVNRHDIDPAKQKHTSRGSTSDGDSRQNGAQSLAKSSSNLPGHRRIFHTSGTSASTQPAQGAQMARSPPQQALDSQ